MDAFQLIGLILFFLVFATFPNKPLRLVVSTLGAFTVAVALMFLLIGGGLGDDRFWFHLNVRDILLGTHYLGMKKWLVLPVLVAGYTLFWFGGRWLYRRSFFKRFHAIVVLILLTGWLSLPGGVFNRGVFVVIGNGGNQPGLHNALESAGIPAESYVYPSDVQAKAGKHIVVLYVESFELGFLHRKDLTPNLNRLAQSMALLPLRQGPGSDWSAGSFYTGMSGLPAFFSFGSGGNRIFQDTREMNLTGVGHVLKTAGYERTFLLGNKQFAGLDAMLSAGCFKVKSEQDLTTAYAKVPWGLHDVDLFAEAKKELNVLQSGQQPFAFYMATIGTHGPEGFYDSRVEEMNLLPSLSQLEKMVAATDAMIGDFVAFLESTNLLENTALYIMPDHLFMGDSPVVKAFDQPRSLYLLTNAIEPGHDTLEQIDVPRIILQGAEVEHNAVFLTDFIKDRPSSNYLLSHKREIEQLNEASVRGENLASGFTLQRDGENVVLKAPFIEKRVSLSPEHQDNVYCFVLDHKFRIKSEQRVSMYQGFYDGDDDFLPRLLIGEKKGALYCAMRYGNRKILSKWGDDEIVFSASDIELLRQWPYSPAFYTLPQYPDYHTPDRRLYVTSSAKGDAQIKTPSEIRFGDQKINIDQSGIWLVRDDETVLFIDPLRETDVLSLKTYSKNPEKVKCILVHENGSGPYNAVLKDVGLIKLSNIGKNSAYVAYPEHGLFSERTNAITLSFSFALTGRKVNSDAMLARWSKEQSRFIAHAGGAIDGLSYTNSLEALDRSYHNGFRQFELDFQRSSDGEFVATHDWLKWHEMTGVAGREAVSRSVFLSHKIRGRYTPLDMNRVNQWFKEHPDAVLVTDKVNEPSAFVEAFAFPDRLVMELFSTEAVMEAEALEGVEVMPSQCVLQSLSTECLAFLKRHHIERVAVSWRFLRENPGMCEQLSENGIKLYVYHLNQKDLKNEVDVLLEELPVAYGMYADDWCF